MMPADPLDLDALPAPDAPREVRRFRRGAWQSALDDLAEEVPVALEFNGISHAVMLATPADLEDFALGFALSEGIIAEPGECYGAEPSVSPQGITMHIDIAARAFAQLKVRRRNLAGRTGCGLCGTENLAEVLREVAALGRTRRVSRQAIAAAQAALVGNQALQRRTGAMHAAAWCSSAGEIVLFREDVGRHNALDKLIGALARTPGWRGKDGFVLMTSRASVEIVQKAAQAGIEIVAAVSAATHLAVKVAEQTGMTLVGFVRGDECVIYTGFDRIEGSV
ncbi:formate dehydrogenase accessory protein [Pandoraea thiooxydans]|uniref:Sulfur carrier protein FdhD n=1 Tax=Pandoraea thiooxydans TaxID=445709 RepID=A0A0G3EWS5_9BURK|nr:formate dehydrogenase accessory sulfurtransferase FdhD [Pandoraea thiooxydans]AKJ70449.2 formate dehydrogenase family accessory protein FdhD [Pandoraea thiooxydans]APR95408.1 formate dehydrogenase accessory protein [Pandoraea thiooxydans]